MSSVSADQWVDRRNLRRKLSFWRVLAALILAALVVVAGYRMVGPGTDGVRPFERHIARISINGLITGDRESLKLIDDAADSNAAAIVLNIESPGGTTTGSERLYEELRLAAAKKPVVAVVGTMAASGAYIAALGSDRIFARGNSLVGSIGVLFQFPNFSGILGKVGIAMEEIKSSPLKAAPNGFEPTSPEAREALASLVRDSFDWFKALVKDRRHMSDAELATVSDGRVFTARQGLPLKLVDAIGGEREAIAWLETEKNIPKNLPIRDWRPPGRLQGWGLFTIASTLADLMGADRAGEAIRALGGFGDARVLDGLVAVWQAPGAR